MLAELSRREKEANIKPDPDIDLFMKASAAKGQEENVVTDYIMKLLGLEICADTMVGNEMIRGISGGQRKHVTTGEMLVGPAKVLLMDEISTGLDSSTTYQIVNAIRQSNVQSRKMNSPCGRKIFSQKKEDFYKWSRVKIRYCDGASFTGDVEAVNPVR